MIRFSLCFFSIQVHLAYAEMFVINENSMVVGFQHCKTKSFEDCKPALQRIWSQQRDITTEVVWTDNVRSDKNSIYSLYKEFKPDASLLVGQVTSDVCPALNTNFSKMSVGKYQFTFFLNQTQEH